MINRFFKLLIPDKNSKRLNLIDTVRGLTILNMIAYHFLWDLVFLCAINIPFFQSDVADYWEQAICCLFIIISGFCFNLSKNSLKRGITVFISGLAVTTVTLIIIPENRIIFGILTFIGSAMIICSLLKKIINKIPDFLGLFVNLLLFIITKPINNGYIWFFKRINFSVPFTGGLLYAFFGFPDDSFYSADYFRFFRGFSYS